jgi:hypothetical protein
MGGLVPMTVIAETFSADEFGALVSNYTKKDDVFHAGFSQGKWLFEFLLFSPGKGFEILQREIQLCNVGIRPFCGSSGVLQSFMTSARSICRPPCFAWKQTRLPNHMSCNGALGMANLIANGIYGFSH